MVWWCRVLCHRMWVPNAHVDVPTKVESEREGFGHGVRRQPDAGRVSMQAKQRRGSFVACPERHGRLQVKMASSHTLVRRHAFKPPQPNRNTIQLSCFWFNCLSRIPSVGPGKQAWITLPRCHLNPVKRKRGGHPPAFWSDYIKAVVRGAQLGEARQAPTLTTGSQQSTTHPSRWIPAPPCRPHTGSRTARP